MEIRVKYYGMLAEVLETESELLNFSGTDIDLRKELLVLRPKLDAMSFSIAVNNVLTETLPVGEDIQDISLLPPFAGG